MKRIGIFGGSFNPIHLGHTALAAYICEQQLVDEVWLMVSPHNPLKENSTLIDENQRLAMARLATAPYPMLKASDFEFTLPRPSYTYHTLQALRAAHPDCQFSLIIGQDNWQCFNRWYRGDDIARETPIIVYPRDTEGTEAPAQGKGTAQDKALATPGPQPTILTNPPLLPYSSTEVRQHIADGKDTSHMLHPDVAQYIEENNLYTTQ